MIKGLTHLTCKERLREVGLLSQETRRFVVGDPSTCTNTQRGGVTKTRGRLFSVVSFERTRGHRHKLKHKRESEWNRLPGEIT